MVNNDIKSPTLFVSIKSPEGVVFEGNVIALSSYNDNGPFDILPMHANFISIVKNKIIIYENKKTVKEFKLDNAILKASNNNVKVFLGIENLKV